MPLNEPITPGVIDWTGENPGILLQDDNGDFSALALFFRVAWSPVGQGQVLLLLLLGSPESVEGAADATNVILSDNPEVTAFLKTNFISNLAAFANAPAYATLPEIAAQSVRTGGDPMSHRYTETIAGPDLAIELVWEQLEKPRVLELSPHEVASGGQNMFSLLVPAHAAQIIVNGHLLPGKLGTRVQAGFESTSAFLYFSETWIIPPEVS